MSLSEKDYFVVGEAHSISVNAVMMFEIIKYLNSSQGYRYFVWEVNYELSYLINEYLNDGDELLLKKALRQYGRDREAYLTLFEKLYNLNLSLDENRKIKFIGIDINTRDKSFVASMQFVKEILTDVKYKGAKEYLHKLNNLYTGDNKKKFKKEKAKLKNILSILLEDLSQNKDQWQEELTSRHFVFEYTVKTLHKSIDIDFRKRDKYMYENFRTLTNQLRKEKFIILMGSYHTDFREEKTFAHFLADKVGRGNIFFSTMVYDNSLLKGDYNKEYLKELNIKTKDIIADNAIILPEKDNTSFDAIFFFRNYPLMTRLK